MTLPPVCFVILQIPMAILLVGGVALLVRPSKQASAITTRLAATSTLVFAALAIAMRMLGRESPSYDYWLHVRRLLCGLSIGFFCVVAMEQKRNGQRSNQ